MSTLLGNICLFLAALVSGALITSVINYKPPLGGDGGVAAFPIWMLLLHFTLLISMGIVTFVIAANGGFDWIPVHKYLRYLLVALGLLLAVYTSLMSAMMLQQSGSVPAWVGSFLRYGYILIPVVLIASGIILNNSFLRKAVPAPFYQWPLVVVLGLGLLVAVAGIFEWWNQGSPIEKQQAYESGAGIISMRLKEIEAADISEDLVRILEYTRPIYPSEVQDKAVAKIKSHPTWQPELILLLQDDRVRYALPFFASNDVDDKKLFAGPLRKGLLQVAANIRHDIQGTSPSAFSKDMFSEEIAAALQVVEKYDGMGVDYLPAMRDIRAALDEPVGGKIMVFDCRRVLDKWLEGR